MHREWRSFLQDRSARFEGETFLGFADAGHEAEAAANATVLAVLSDHTLLRVHGADAQSFLNSQLSKDVRHVATAHSQLAAWCNAKGRIVTLARTFKRGDDYYLLLPADLRETVRERLQRYILRAKVTLESDDALVTLGISGPQTDLLLRRIMS
ncbi:MAG: folate-binding protein, partial [Pseudomonadota bacterium]